MMSCPRCQRKDTGSLQMKAQPDRPALQLVQVFEIEQEDRVQSAYRKSILQGSQAQYLLSSFVSVFCMI